MFKAFFQIQTRATKVKKGQQLKKKLATKASEFMQVTDYYAFKKRCPDLINIRRHVFQVCVLLPQLAGHT